MNGNLVTKTFFSELCATLANLTQVGCHGNLWFIISQNQDNNQHGTKNKDGGVEGPVFIVSCENTKVTTKLLNSHWQANVGSPPAKDTQHPRAKEKPQQDGRRGKFAFSILPQTGQTLQGHKQNLVSTGLRKKSDGPRKGLSQTCLWVFEGLLQRHRSAVTCHRDWGSGCNRLGRRSISSLGGGRH